MYGSVRLKSIDMLLLVLIWYKIGTIKSQLRAKSDLYIGKLYCSVMNAEIILAGALLEDSKMFDNMKLRNKSKS